MFKRTDINTFRLITEEEAQFNEIEYPILLDDNGAPKLFYHGTDRNFPLFHFGLKTPSTHSRNGPDDGKIFFTDDKIAAGYYGKYIITAHLRGIIGENIKVIQENLSAFEYVDYPYDVFIMKDRRQALPFKKESIPHDWKGVKELADHEKYYKKYMDLVAAGEADAPPPSRDN